MAQKWLTFLSIGVITLIVFGFFIMYLLPVKAPINPDIQALKSSATAPTVTYINPQLGPIQAPVTIITFSDFSCSACQQLAGSLALVHEAYPQQVRIVWRNLPNDAVNPLAFTAAMAAHCALQQNRFWDYHDQLFNSQALISEEQLFVIAQNLEMDTDAFARCLSQEETRPIVQHDKQEAQALGLTATPTLFINNQQFTGAISAANLINYVENLLQP